MHDVLSMDGVGLAHPGAPPALALLATAPLLCDRGEGEPAHGARCCTALRNAGSLIFSALSRSTCANARQARATVSSSRSVLPRRLRR